MPKRNDRASAGALSPADALIAEAVARGSAAPAVPDKARAELEKILAHNDRHPVASKLRVTSDAALALMQELGWSVKSHHTLNSYCRTVLGRRSFASP